MKCDTFGNMVIRKQVLMKVHMKLYTVPNMLTLDKHVLSTVFRKFERKCPNMPYTRTVCEKITTQVTLKK